VKGVNLVLLDNLKHKQQLNSFWERLNGVGQQQKSLHI